MYIPDGFTEEEVIQTIYRVARRLAHKFKFGFHSDQDIIQQAFIIVIQSDCLSKYDTSRPLENFLASHLKNRLYNFKRDNYARPESPCLSCPLKAYLPPDGCSAYEDKLECKFYSRWINSNTSKKNIINTVHIDNIVDNNETRMCYNQDLTADLFNTDLHKKILDELSFRSRKFYIMFLNNCSVKRSDLDFMRAEIEEIVNG